MEATKIQDSSKCPIPAERKLEVKKWNPNNLYTPKINADITNCDLCHKDIMALCSDCYENRHMREEYIEKHGECLISWGLCDHSFHFHCIMKSLKTNDMCPSDNQHRWKFQNFENTY